MFALETVLSECCTVAANVNFFFYYGPVPIVILTAIISIRKCRNISVLLTHLFKVAFKTWKAKFLQHNKTLFCRHLLYWHLKCQTEKISLFYALNIIY